MTNNEWEKAAAASWKLQQRIIKLEDELAYLKAGVKKDVSTTAASSSDE